MKYPVPEDPFPYPYLGIRRPRRRAAARRADVHATGMLAMTCTAGRVHTRTGIYFIIPTHLVTMVGGARPHEARRRRCRRCPSQVRFQSLQP